jgi:hypothetical protein
VGAYAVFANYRATCEKNTCDSLALMGRPSHHESMTASTRS